MLGITDFWAFVAAVLVFLALPGPGTFTLLTATGKAGFRAQDSTRPSGGPPGDDARRARAPAAAGGSAPG